MAHNGIIKGDNLYIPYYHDGLRVFDISDPTNPIQTWKYDTYAPSSHASYKGAWGVYPYLSSGNIIVSDMQTGLYIVDVTSGTAHIIEINLKPSIYPIPATNQITITNNTANNFTLYNSLGAKLMDIAISKNQTIIKRGNLANGLYFYSLNKGWEQIESGKVLFE
jgi:hypothetical protein